MIGSGGANTVEETILLRFELCKWTSNNLCILSGSGTLTKLVLGISWRPESDELIFDSSVCDNADTSTKQSILSRIAKMYDPLGLVAPVIVRAKILMQELWLF
uniref:Uncharacterized protein n=1 Tax=Anopheles epiroticus TaxID=199890 RepID=A0A182NZE3_9DIPT